MHQQRHGLYVLDEFTYRGRVDVAEIVEPLVRGPGYQHVVITG